MGRRTFPLLFCLLLTAGGCSRTDDGTIVIPQSLDMRSLDLGPLDLRHPGRLRPAETPRLPVAAVPEPFPISPQAKRVGERRTATRTAQRTRVRPRPAADPAAPLACKPARKMGERIQVRCD